MKISLNLLVFPGGEISAIVDFVSSCFNRVSVTATMSRF